MSADFNNTSLSHSSSTHVSPFAPKAYPELLPLEGIQLTISQLGIKYANHSDVLVVAFPEETEIAGVFTRNICSSAPVEWCRKHLKTGKSRLLLVNSGNANAFTGTQGRRSVEEIAASASAAAKVKVEEVFLASTGVIGEPLESHKFISALPSLIRNLQPAVPALWREAAQSIMTTDTYPKLAIAQTHLHSVPITVQGIAKGAGMIAPNMGTLLSFIFTDAPIPAPLLQKLVSRSVENTFNAITIDGDTSTSDTLLVFATGTARHRGVPILQEDRHPLELISFQKALEKVMLDLAHQVVKDGEGARHFIEIHVKGAASKAAAKKIAFSVANSPLIKTAMAAQDANWGRIVAAIGKTGEEILPDQLSIWMNHKRVAYQGARDPDYKEDEISALMKNENINILIDLALGEGQATVWTCDLTEEYVKINGSYRS